MKKDKADKQDNEDIHGNEKNNDLKGEKTEKIKEKSKKDSKEQNNDKKEEKKDDKKDGNQGDMKEENKEKPKEKPNEKTLEEKYNDALEEIKSLKEKKMYLQAEMENSRKIMLKRIDIEKYNSRVNTIKTFLPVGESITAAIARLEKDPSLKTENGNNKYLDGFKTVQNQYMQILKGTGVKPIDEVNVPFDYKKHEVMMKFEDDSKPDDTVIQIVQTGWYIDQNVLRPAKVIVSKKKEKPKPVMEIKIDEEKSDEIDKDKPSEKAADEEALKNLNQNKENSEEQKETPINEKNESGNESSNT